MLNNGSHESVGGQPTVAQTIKLNRIAENCGYNFSLSVKTANELRSGLKALIETKGPGFLEVMIRQGSRPDLGRPTISPIDNKNDYMKNLLND